MLLPIIMAIVNATVPVGNGQVQIPLSVTPAGVQAQTTVAVAPGIDLAALGGIITTITAAMGALGFKLVKDGKRDDTRSNIIAETAQKQVQSLQETDKADYIFRAAIADYIADPHDESRKARLIQLAQESKTNYKSYYENIQPQPLDYSKDQVVQKMSAVQKRTTPNPTVVADDK